ncbi:GNAT family N-acetyltransferase [Zooshikella sp. RANM57]|uniref:GNAT family N-acetyltransferase n=1 Tax=Zooshikella sp. RANM57 TaxID=3425863 RepID=UPI003D6F69D6
MADLPFKTIALDTHIHDRQAFDCGNEDLNHYLQRTANQHGLKYLSQTFVLTRREQRNRIRGFYSIGPCEVDTCKLPAAFMKKYNGLLAVPCIRINRLAVDLSEHGKGLGKVLIIDALMRSLVVAKSVGSAAVIVDAKTKELLSFYEKCGFMVYDELSLFLPMKTIKDLFADLVQ